MSERHPPQHETRIHIVSFVSTLPKWFVWFMSFVVPIPNLNIYLQLSDVCGILAGLLRYKVDFQSMQCDEIEDDLYDIDDY
jgi:hypothetical protein